MFNDYLKRILTARVYDVAQETPLKGKEAGAILAVLTPDKAARLSQRLLQ